MTALSLATTSGGMPAGATMPYQIATHPLAGEYLSVVPAREGPLHLTIGAMIKADAAVSPAIRHFIAHLHRAAHQAGRAAR